MDMFEIPLDGKCAFSSFGLLCLARCPNPSNRSNHRANKIKEPTSVHDVRCISPASDSDASAQPISDGNPYRGHSCDTRQPSSDNKHPHSLYVSYVQVRIRYPHFDMFLCTTRCMMCRGWSSYPLNVRTLVHMAHLM